MTQAPDQGLCGGQCACIACQPRLCAFTGPVPNRVPRRRVNMQRGDRVEELRDNCLKFWVLLSGTGAICTSFPDGRRQIVSLTHSGEVVCGLISTGDSPNWLEALEDCELCEIDLSQQAPVLAGNSEFMRTLLELAHGRLETVSRHVATLGRLDSSERVILFLAEMADRAGAREAAARPVRLPMSREDIADYLGLNTETVSRILTRLRKSGIVKFLSPTEYVIPEFAAMERRLPVRVTVAQTTMFGSAPDSGAGKEDSA